MLQQIGIWVLSAGVVLVLALWSTRTARPWGPAVVFALARGTISFATGATTLTFISTGIVAFVLGALYFWLLQRAQGRLLWWFILAIGVVLFSI